MTVSLSSFAALGSRHPALVAGSGAKTYDGAFVTRPRYKNGVTILRDDRGKNVRF